MLIIDIITFYCFNYIYKLIYPGIAQTVKHIFTVHTQCLREKYLSGKEFRSPDPLAGDRNEMNCSPVSALRNADKFFISRFVYFRNAKKAVSLLNQNQIIKHEILRLY